jgi:hypothetical protein
MGAFRAAEWRPRRLLARRQLLLLVLVRRLLHVGQVCCLLVLREGILSTDAVLVL